MLGIATSEGNIWYEQRKFIVKNLSDLGMGKRDTMEDVIDQEADQLVDLMRHFTGNRKNAHVSCCTKM